MVAAAGRRQFRHRLVEQLASTRKETVSILDAKWLWLSLLALLSLLIRAVCFTGLIGSADDLGYYQYAHLISQGLYSPDLHHYAIRYGLTVPVAFVYRVFGTTEWTTVAVPYLASVASVLVVVVIGHKLFDFRTGFTAGFLLATFPLSIHFATILVPEPVAQLYVLLAIVLYLYTDRRYSPVLAVASGVFLALAYLTKEWSLFIVPAVLIDAAVRRRWRVCSFIAAGAIAVLGIEHLYYWVSTGDVLFRLHALSKVVTDPYALDESRYLAYRLFKHYPRMMLVPSRDFGIHSLFTLVLIPVAFLTARFRQLLLLILWALIPFLFMNFGSLSFSHYMPMFSQPRYLEIIYPPLFLMAGLVIERSTVRGWRFVWLVALAVVALIGCYCGFVTRGKGFYTDHVAAMRNIVKDATAQHLTRICFEGEANEFLTRWRRTMAILAPNLEDSRSGHCDITVRPGASGIPTSSRLPGA
jgi:Dolichyl-phosphate-mannose-protein mannosyltransferase